jgi:hypothetical protein
MTPLSKGWRMVALLGGLAVIPAVAWSTDQNIDVTANVPKFCQFTSVPGFTGAINATGTPLLGTSTVSIDTAATSSGIMNDFAFTFTANALCNTPSKFHLTSLGNGLKPSPVPTVSSGTFRNHINYQASGKWNGGVASGLTTTGGTGPLHSTDRMQATAVAGQVTVDVTAVLNTSAPLLAGTYADTLRLTLEPQ